MMRGHNIVAAAMATRCILDRLRFRVRYRMSEYDYDYDSPYLCPRTITITSTQCVIYKSPCTAKPILVKLKERKRKTRPDTWPPVADGWAGAEMRVFPLFDSIITDRRTDGPTDGRTNGRTDGWTDKASFRVACP